MSLVRMAVLWLCLGYPVVVWLRRVGMLSLFSSRRKQAPLQSCGHCCGKTLRLGSLGCRYSITTGHPRPGPTCCQQVLGPCLATAQEELSQELVASPQASPGPSDEEEENTPVLTRQELSSATPATPQELVVPIDVRLVPLESTAELHRHARDWYRMQAQEWEWSLLASNALLLVGCCRDNRRRDGSALKADCVGYATNEASYGFPSCQQRLQPSCEEVRAPPGLSYQRPYRLVLLELARARSIVSSPACVCGRWMDVLRLLSNRQNEKVQITSSKVSSRISIEIITCCAVFESSWPSWPRLGLERRQRWPP